jgi:hypothetical protein
MESQRDGASQPHTMKPTQLNRPRNRLKPSHPHVWSFKLSLPACIVSGEQPATATLDSASSLAPQVPYSKLHPDVGRDYLTESAEAEGEKGGIRTEMVGYGVGWNEGDSGGSSRRHTDTTEKGDKWNVLTEPGSIGTSQPEDGTSKQSTLVLPSSLQLFFRRFITICC